MITSYYTTKLGLQPETIAYRDRVETDGGEVIDLGYVDSVYKKLKELNLLASLKNWTSPKAGIKKDLSNAVSVMYSLSNTGDIIQNNGSFQPILEDEKIIFDGVDKWMETVDDSVSFLEPDVPFSINVKANVLSNDTIRFTGRILGSFIIVGFSPNVGNTQFLLGEDVLFRGFNGSPTIADLNLAGKITDFNYTTDGSNFRSDGMKVYINNNIINATEGGNTESISEINFSYNNLILGRNGFQYSKHNLFEMSVFDIELNQSQILELNAL